MRYIILLINYSLLFTHLTVHSGIYVFFLYNINKYKWKTVLLVTNVKNKLFSLRVKIWDYLLIINLFCWKKLVKSEKIVMFLSLLILFIFLFYTSIYFDLTILYINIKLHIKSFNIKFNRSVIPKHNWNRKKDLTFSPEPKMTLSFKCTK